MIEFKSDAIHIPSEALFAVIEGIPFRCEDSQVLHIPPGQVRAVGHTFVIEASLSNWNLLLGLQCQSENAGGLWSGGRRTRVCLRALAVQVCGGLNPRTNEMSLKLMFLSFLLSNLKGKHLMDISVRSLWFRAIASDIISVTIVTDISDEVTTTLMTRRILSKKH